LLVSHSQCLIDVCVSESTSGDDDEQSSMTKRNNNHYVIVGDFNRLRTTGCGKRTEAKLEIHPIKDYFLETKTTARGRKVMSIILLYRFMPIKVYI